MELLTINLSSRRMLVSLFDLRMIIGVGVTMELPDVDSIILSGGDNHAIVKRVEHGVDKGVCVTNERLEVERNSLLRLIVPNLEQVVLTTSEHVATIQGQVSASYCTLMHGMQLTKVRSFESCEAINSDALIFSHDNYLSVVFGKLEGTNHVANVYLMLENDGIGAVDHQVIAVFTHNSEKGLHDNEIFVDAQVLALILPGSIFYDRC